MNVQLRIFQPIFILIILVRKMNPFHAEEVKKNKVMVKYYS